MMHIEAKCARWESTAVGALVLAPHQFEAEGFSAGQVVLITSGDAAVLLGDKAQNESSDHSAARQGVVLAVPRPAEATVANAGQSVLFVRGTSVAVLNGQLSVCCDMAPVRAADAVLSPAQESRLFVGGSAVVTGRSP